MFARRVSGPYIQTRDERRAPAERGNPPRGGSSTKRRAAVRILEEVAGVLLKRPRR